MKKTTITFSLFFLLIVSGLAQYEHPLYDLEEQLLVKEADIHTLYELSEYFDSNKKFTSSVGHHIFPTTESNYVKGIFLDHTLFLEKEFKITDSTTTIEAHEFLSDQQEHIIFSSLARRFLITPLEYREVDFEIHEITNFKINKLKENKDFLFRKSAAKDMNLGVLYQEKDPKILLDISSGLVQQKHIMNDIYLLEILRFCTHTNILIKNSNGIKIENIENTYNAEDYLNLLIYFKKYYHEYQWDDEKEIFIHPKFKVVEVSNQRENFDLLRHEDDSIALNAFIELTQANPEEISKIIDRRNHSFSGSMNYVLPSFGDKFLRQFSQLTEYCRNENIDFIGTEKTQTDLNLLEFAKNQKERYAIENRIISELTLEEVTAYEYWFFIKQKDYNISYSAGRILDKFYSKNWNEIIQNKRHLNLYLKKSHLFDHLGIIGNCNNYLLKFAYAPDYILEKISNLETKDVDIQKQIDKILSKEFMKPILEDEVNFSWGGHQDLNIEDYQEKFLEQINIYPSTEASEDSLITLISQMEYEHIPFAIEQLSQFKFIKDYLGERYKERFLESDFGFINYNLHQDKNLNIFLENYKKYSEYEMYEWYLDEMGIDYKDENNQLDYDKIHNILKYDVVNALSGGGGGTRDYHVYGIVRILELTHKTRLGFSPKFCTSKSIYGCSTIDRTHYWIKYLTENELLKEKDQEPISFSKYN